MAAYCFPEAVKSAGSYVTMILAFTNKARTCALHTRGNPE